MRVIINSIGGCYTAAICNHLKNAGVTIINDSIEGFHYGKSYHYQEPMPANADYAIFLYSKDIATCIQSQINRNLNEVNYWRCQLHGDDTTYSLENWVTLIKKQIDNWMFKKHQFSYKIISVNVDEIESKYYDLCQCLGIKYIPFKIIPRETKRISDEVRQAFV